MVPELRYLIRDNRVCFLCATSGQGTRRERLSTGRIEQSTYLCKRARIMCTHLLLSRRSYWHLSTIHSTYYYCYCICNDSVHNTNA